MNKLAIGTFFFLDSNYFHSGREWGGIPGESFSKAAELLSEAAKNTGESAEATKDI